MKKNDVGKGNGKWWKLQGLARQFVSDGQGKHPFRITFEQKIERRGGAALWVSEESVPGRVSRIKGLEAGECLVHPRKGKGARVAAEV